MRRFAVLMSRYRSLRTVATLTVVPRSPMTPPAIESGSTMVIDSLVLRFDIPRSSQLILLDEVRLYNHVPA